MQTLIQKQSTLILPCLYIYTYNPDLQKNLLHEPKYQTIYKKATYTKLTLIK